MGDVTMLEQAYDLGNFSREATVSVEPHDVAILTAVASIGRVVSLFRRRRVRHYLAKVPPSVVILVVSLAVLSGTG